MVAVPFAFLSGNKTLRELDLKLPELIEEKRLAIQFGKVYYGEDEALIRTTVIEDFPQSYYILLTKKEYGIMKA